MIFLKIFRFKNNIAPYNHWLNLTEGRCGFSSFFARSKFLVNQSLLHRNPAAS